MRPLPRVLLLAVTLSLPITCIAGQAPPRQAGGRWTAVSGGVLKQLEQKGHKPAWPGKTTGVAVDKATGNVFMIVCGLGVWRSDDRGATFARVDGGTVGGRCETGYALRVDPKTAKLVEKAE